MKILGLRIPFTKAAVSPLGVPQVYGPGGRPGFLGYVREAFAGAWQNGSVELDSHSDMLTFSAVFACVTRIAGDIAKMRIRLVELKSGIWVEVPSEINSPFWPVLRKPNNYQNRIQFIVCWVISKLLYGNTYVLKVRDSRGVVTQLHVLDPRRVLPLVTLSGEVYYQLGRDDLASVPEGKVVVPAAEIIHDRGVTLYHPLVGVSPLHAAGFAATQGRKIQKNSAVFFDNMSRPSGILSGPGVINDATADRLKVEFEKNFSLGKLGRLAVLGDGLKYEPMTIPAEDAQLIEQLRWTVEDVARSFGVPLYKINSGAMPTSNNVEALELQYYSGCLQILIESIELCLDEGLALPTNRGTEFDLDGLARMDSTAMGSYLSTLVKAGLMAPNEGRKRINLPDTAGGETPYLQQQNWSLAQLAKRDINATPAPAPTPPTDEDEEDDATDQAQEDQEDPPTPPVAPKRSARARRERREILTNLMTLGSAQSEQSKRMEELVKTLGTLEQRLQPVVTQDPVATVEEDLDLEEVADLVNKLFAQELSHG